MSTAKRTVPKNLRPDRFRWSLMLACNHYRNGGFQGFVDSVEIGAGRGNFTYGTDYLDDHGVTLTGPRVSFRFSKKRKNVARLGTVVFESRNYKEWVGNWCWDACMVSRETVREIAKMLKKKGWTAESASGLLCDWFDRMK